MNIEIERKFLVRNDKWREISQGILYRQAYLGSNNKVMTRIRITGEIAFLTLKSKPVKGFARMEFEYEIPVHDAEMLINLSEWLIVEKTRYKIKDGEVTWEIDEFHQENEGLIVAEVELEDENQEFALPEWIGEEVTNDHRYKNSSLARFPFKIWGK